MYMTGYGFYMGEEYGIRGYQYGRSGNNGAAADAGYGEGGTDGW